MKTFTFQTVANAVAIAVAAWLVGGIELTGDGTWDTVLTLILVALLFGLVNWLVKPVVSLLSLPLFILTLGLFTLVVNALMLWLTSWLSDQTGLTFHVDGFWAAFWGALIVSVVSWAVNVVLPDGD
ncbi:phage holin family protein [Streptomyces sp. HB2AG]|uniref:phage holin family protein n=1 Tax=Streptomyces sp. HB2AG TaxID=2983400 RepID=UPI0022A9FCE8|nr:phage holin family protein [Streptomyces sp. HB2AG]MCZ2525121.1 phage holin family protein [Streptomyces sp. HB2AG]